MQTISFIRSLMEFNKRVLHQGKLQRGKSYNMEDLKSKLFFNSVFISNMQEMFQRYDTSPIVDDYIDSMGTYMSNVSAIIKHASVLKPKIKISRDDSFERRIAVDKIMGDQVISQFYPSIENASSHRFINGEIYYISLLINGYITISFVDPRRSIYHDLIKCDFPDYTMYWKADDCIKAYIHDAHQTVSTIAIRVTTSLKESSEVTKVEYNGDTEFMRKIIAIFPSSALVISNPFIYTDDVKRVIETNIDIKPPVPKPAFDPIKLESIFEHDLLIEYPNDSFDEYLQFLSLASKHDGVKSIALTLYRIGDNPAIFYILRDAVAHGIKVHVNIELFASGESINRLWQKEMLNAGIKVTTYEAGRLKVHAKLTLIKFHNGKSISQIGTGNYHTQTTTQYTDFSLITSNSSICDQVKRVFELLNGDEDVAFNKDLLVTRYNARKELIKLIDTEARKGVQGNIIIKCNALDDAEISYHLDMAASNGCNMTLIVRGVCTWIPQVETGNVKVKSIVWDKLEHSRVYCFGSHNPTIYLGSLDLVTKKIDQRVEALVRIIDPDVEIKICEYLNRYVTSTEGSWIQTSSGMYIKE